MIVFLDKVIYWSIILLPFSIMIAPAFAFAFIGIMSFFFLVKKVMKKEWHFINTPVNMPFLLLIAATLISIKNTINLPGSIHGVSKIIVNGLIFLVCAEEIKDKKHIQKIFISIVCGGVLTAIDVLWQLKFGVDFIRYRPLMTFVGIQRATAAFPHPNALGIYMCAIVPLIVGMTFFYFKGRIKKLMLIASALAICGLFFSFSRSAGLGAFIAILLISVIKKNKIITCTLLIGLLIFPFVMPQKIKDWGKSVNYNPIIFMLNPERISIYKNALNMIKHHPVIGVGVNTFTRNYPLYKLPEPKGAETPNSIYAHNIYLHMASEIGLLGLIIFLWLLFRLFKSAPGNYAKLSDGYLKIFYLSATLCIVAFLINGMAETNLYNPRVAMIFWYLIGVVLSFSKFKDTAKVEGK